MMVYSSSDLSKLKLKIVQLIHEELDKANDSGCIESVLNKYGIEFEEEPLVPVNTTRMKILVLGPLECSINYCYLTANKLNISADKLEFETDYKRLQRFDGDNLRYSYKYSDIIVGPMPHSTEGKGEYSSLIARIKNEPSCYPKLIECIANNQLKITKSSFYESLKKTNYLKEIEKFTNLFV